MSTKRTRYRAQLKFQLAMEAAKGLKTINELARAHGVHPTQISEWTRQRLDAGDTFCNRDGARHHREPQVQEVELYEHIGRLKMEREWLKKNVARFSEGQTHADRLGLSPQQHPPSM
jgi:transposase-like protein